MKHIFDMKGLFIVTSLFTLCKCGSRTRKFQRQEEQRLVDDYQNITGISSAVQCIAACGHDAGCTAVSYHAADEVCSLSEEGNITVIIPGWTVFKHRSPCGAEWVKNNGWCYLCVKELKSWVDAEDYCQGFGAHLVKLDNEHEYTFITELPYLSASCKGMINFWIGLNDRDVERTYRWVSDETVKTFKKWAANQATYNTLENCISQWLGEWYDQSCMLPLGAVCEKEDV